MRIPVNTYRIVCDACGEHFENSLGWSCYTDDPNEIENDASDSSWLITEDGHHYCHNCRELNDEDQWECKDGKTYTLEGEPINKE